VSVVLSEHLPLLATAPDGIQKLRRLILDLAVRGKIVPVDINQSVVTTLGKVGKWAVGSGFPIAEQGKVGLEILFAKVSDMNLTENTKFITTTNHTISRESARRLRVNIHPAGTVVFPKIGGAIATNKRRVLVQDTAIDNNCLGITPKEGVNSDWLFVLLSSFDLTKYQAGTSVPALAQGVLSEIPVLLPPLAEQHRIVAKVGELMALCDRLETEQADSASAHARLVETLLGTLAESTNAVDLANNWQRLAEHFDTLFATEVSLDALKKTVLQLAIMGKLVPQDPNDEPASELIRRIADERVRLESAGVCKKAKPLPPIAESELTFDLPRNWVITRLGVAIDLVSGQHLTPDEYSNDLSNPIPYLTGPAEFGDKFPNPTRSTTQTRAIAIAGDILVTVKGSGVGKLNRVSQKELAISRQLMAVRTIAVDNDFIELLLRSAEQHFQDQTVGIAIPGIGRDDVQHLPLGLPPLPEQQRIVAKVQSLMALCDRLKADLATARDRQATLADTLIDSSLEAA